jgi:methylphosphotriester-DNA--protein-cysteine methyltransferase
MYVHGASINKPQVLRKTAEQVKADLEHLRRIEAQILAETAAKEAELARIRAARKRLEPKATYLPTAAAIAYWEEHHEQVAQQPAPLHGGPQGLRKATAEAAAHDARKAAA